ncbi:MAG: twin-arginine translocation pathway signal [Rhodospirillaceae bacterium]|nr:MAG: twin-arginine translocation pathway signal [Rhodospirillaceae bacterium]
MSLTRRQFSAAAAMSAAVPQLPGKVLAQQTGGAGPSAGAGPMEVDHDMSSMPAHWMGSEQIAFLVYPQFTALDMVGPHHMLTSLMGAKVHLVARTRDPVQSDTGLVVMPSMTFDECPADLDIICVPGGSHGTLAAMKDDATMLFLKDRGNRAKYVTSVCTGSLLLGAAGLLAGYRATSHWATKGLLPLFGATPADGRVVVDQNRITGGGVTAGIDFGLTLVGHLRDRQYAEGVQLMAEYDPKPPYSAGTPERAPAEVRTLIEGMFTGFVSDADKESRIAFAKFGRLQ